MFIVETINLRSRGRITMARRKSQTTTASPITQPNALVTSPIAPVALLIDGENVIAPDLIAHILVEAGKMGGVTIRQVYGNWAAPSMQPWKELMKHYELVLMGNGSAKAGRNATDIALVIGAMDLLYSGVKHFCLVAGDSDYVPLVLRLRQAECTVLGIGTPSASPALKEACSRFLSTEQLTPRSKSSVSSTPPRTTTPVEPLPSLLTKAYQRGAKKSEEEWVSLAALGIAL
jgi:NYN domain